MLTSKYSRGCYCSSITLYLWFLWVRATNAEVTVQIGLFADRFCSSAAHLNPSFSIPLNVCVMTPGAFGFNGNNVVCEDGNPVKFLVYFKTACGGDSYYTYYTSILNCHENNDDPIPGFVAYCGSQNQLQITSTTKVPAATSLISSSTGTSSSGNGGQGASTTQQGQQATGSSSSATGSSAHGWNALTNGERIGAIIALAVGIPAVLVAVIGLCIACRR